MVMPTGIGRDELRALTGQGAQLVEVLPAGDYEWAHLPGAVSVPLKELDARAGSWTGPGRSSCTATTGIET
jgi:rhodanese-related sulfurtransferase